MNRISYVFVQWLSQKFPVHSIFFATMERSLIGYFLFINEWSWPFDYSKTGKVGSEKIEKNLFYNNSYIFNNINDII